MSLVQRFIGMLMNEQPEKRFQVRRGRRRSKRKLKLTAYEHDILLKREPEERRESLPIQKILLLGSGLVYLLTREASQKYGISTGTIARLCREGRLVCRKNEENGNLWEVEEGSLRAYLASQ